MSTFGRLLRADERGQAMVEFALVLPLLLLLLFGMLQFALVLNARQTVAYSAQAAANAYAQTLVRQRANAEAWSAAAQLRPELRGAGAIEYRIVHGAAESAITADGIGAFGDFVVAHVRYDYPSPVRARIAGFRFPDALTLSAEAIARIEAQGTAASSTPSIVPTLTRPTGAPTPTPTTNPTPTPFPTPTPRCAYVGIGILYPSTTNLTIAQVSAGGPADLAGIRRGDRVTTLNGRTVSIYRDVRSVVTSPPGTTFTFGATRSGRPLTFTVTTALVVPTWGC